MFTVGSSGLYAEGPMSPSIISNAAFAPGVEALLDIVYDQVLADLQRDFSIATDHGVRSEVANALVTLAKTGQTNSEQLRRYALACGVSQGRRARAAAIAR